MIPSNPPFLFSWKGSPSAVFLSEMSACLREKKEWAGFLEPRDQGLMEKAVSFVSHSPVPENYCIVGIGGSALPARALQCFFSGGKKPGRGQPRFFILDTTDPSTLRSAFSELLARPTQTLFHVISKSGKTLEVEFIRRYLTGHLQRKLPEAWKERFVVTTTPDPGNPLWQWAARNRIRIFELAPSIGGRFSSFSPVTWLSASYLGLDPAAIAEGALAAIADLKSSARFAEVLFDHYRRGRKILGLFIYSDALSGFADLAVQLFSESLGKSGEGLMPVKFTGPKDQHSMLQLYLDGPPDKMVVLLKGPSPPAFAGASSASLHKGEGKERMPSPLGRGEGVRVEAFARAFQAAEEGVYQSLKRRHVPAWRLALQENSPFAYGYWVQFFHLAVVALSVKLNVNPFDQPMVELQKRYTEQYLKRE